MKLKLDKVSDVLIIVTCLITIGFFLYRQFGPNSIERYANGESIDLILKGLLPSQEQAQLVVKLSSKCEYCALSIPYLRTLEKLLVDKKIGIPIILATQEEPELIKRYIDRNELRFDAIVDLRANHSKLANCPVPYVLLLDKRGTVVGNWLGLLTEDRFNDVAEAVVMASKANGQ
jgi:hypothetical protein